MSKCDLLVLSPVHIASGEKYTASEYTQSHAVSNKGNKLKLVKRIDVSKYYLSLDDNLKDDFLRDLSNGEFDLMKFDKNIPNKYSIYTSINKSKEELTPHQEISECIKTLNMPYIPGSSIKGAVKTAILYNQIGEDDLRKLSNEVIGDRNRVIRYHYERFLKNKFSSKFTRNSAQGDVFKFLQVGDSTSIKNPTIYDVAVVMASFKYLTNEYYRKNKGSIKPTLSYLETIPRGSKLSVEIKNNYDSIVFDELKLGKRTKMIEIENIKKALYQFSSDLINNELQFAKDNDIKYLKNFYNDLSKRNTPDSPVLKVGNGSGFLATTVNLKIKEYNSELYDRIRRGLKSKTYDYSFPKSRKVTYSNGMPLGWVKFLFGEI